MIFGAEHQVQVVLLLISCDPDAFHMGSYFQNLTLCTNSVYKLLKNKISLSRFSPLCWKSLAIILGRTDFTHFPPQVSHLVLHMQVYRDGKMRDFSFLVSKQQAKPHFQLNELPFPHQNKTINRISLYRCRVLQSYLMHRRPPQIKMQPAPRAVC